MAKIKIQDMIGKNYRIGFNPDTVAIWDLIECEYPMEIEGKEKITIQDLIETHYPKNIVMGRVKITNLIHSNLSKENEKLMNVALLCDNPQCKRPIKGNHIAFSKDYGEVYHPGDCIRYAIAMKALNSKKVVLGNIDYITRKEALKLKGLEAKAKYNSFYFKL